MAHLHLETLEQQTTFTPGSIIEGVAGWELDTPPTSVELRLFWYTTGKGDQDVGVVDTETWSNPGAADAQAFKLKLPDGPYSFRGRLITLSWAIELLVEPGKRVERMEIVVSPVGEPVSLT